MKLRYLILSAAFALGACGGGPQLPESCRTLLTEYAPLADAVGQRQGTTPSGTAYPMAKPHYLIRLDAFLKQGGNSPDRAVEAWQRQFAADIEAVEHQFGSRSAERETEKQASRCTEWQAKFDAIKAEMAQ